MPGLSFAAIEVGLVDRGLNREIEETTKNDAANCGDGHADDLQGALTLLHLAHVGPEESTEKACQDDGGHKRKGRREDGDEEAGEGGSDHPDDDVEQDEQRAEAAFAGGETWCGLADEEGEGQGEKDGDEETEDHPGSSQKKQVHIEIVSWCWPGTKRFFAVGQTPTG
jgi:hypothetical protein